MLILIHTSVSCFSFTVASFICITVLYVVPVVGQPREKGSATPQKSISFIYILLYLS